MSWAVEIYFDFEADRRVRKIWDELSKRKLHGIPPPLTARPHISLGVWKNINLNVAGPSLNQFASNIAALNFHFWGIGVFPNTGVVYLAPTPDIKLFQLHAGFHNHFAGGEECSNYYLCGNWTPHCTIAEGISPQNVPAITQATAIFELPFDAKASSMGIVEHPGAKLHFHVVS
jgi:2'-5' RNA ligase